MTTEMQICSTWLKTETTHGYLRLTITLWNQVFWIDTAWCDNCLFTLLLFLSWEIESLPAYLLSTNKEQAISKLSSKSQFLKYFSTRKLNICQWYGVDSGESCKRLRSVPSHIFVCFKIRTDYQPTGLSLSTTQLSKALYTSSLPSLLSLHSSFSNT